MFSKNYIYNTPETHTTNRTRYLSALNYEFLVQPTRMEGKNSYCVVKCVIKCVINEQWNCPFRGCAGDWVKLGVAKRHGAVLGDAVSKMADENTKVQLVESDIPGAELPKPAEFCTVAILKRWLSCRGAKVSGNRKDLIKRLDYEPCNVNYFETIVTFAIEVNSLQTAVESFIF